MGLGGEVEVAVLSDAPDRFTAGSVLLLRDVGLTVRSFRMQGQRAIVAFEGVTDRNAAEALKGAELTISAEQARDLEDDEYWDHDLVGCAVVTTAGVRVGEVTDVLHQPANSVLVVRGDGRDHLVPLIGDVVREVEPRTRITIEPMPGLLD